MSASLRQTGAAERRKHAANMPLTQNFAELGPKTSSCQEQKSPGNTFRAAIGRRGLHSGGVVTTWGACSQSRPGHLSRINPCCCGRVTALEFLANAATRLANARVPDDIVQGTAVARLAALQKAGGAGPATADVFRRLVSRALARTWAEVFDQATRPYQFALQARTGTDAPAAHVCSAPGTAAGRGIGVVGGAHCVR